VVHYDDLNSNISICLGRLSGLVDRVKNIDTKQVKNIDTKQSNKRNNQKSKSKRQDYNMK